MQKLQLVLFFNQIDQMLKRRIYSGTGRSDHTDSENRFLPLVMSADFGNGNIELGTYFVLQAFQIPYGARKTGIA